MTAERGVRSPDVCRAVGVSYRQLDYWSRTGLVTASVEASGSGSHRLYSVDDVVRVALVKRLQEAGISVQRIRKALLTS